jgi:hypothetical protein
MDRSESRRRRKVPRIVAASALVAAAVVLTTAAAASPRTGRQAVVIQSLRYHHEFKLMPAKGGSLAADTGFVSFCCWTERVVKRDGQTVEVDVPVLGRFVGKNGTFTLRQRIEWTSAGRGYTVGASTWSLGKGIGAYKGLTGRGRGSTVWPPHGELFFRS